MFLPEDNEHFLRCDISGHVEPTARQVCYEHAWLAVPAARVEECEIPADLCPIGAEEFRAEVRVAGRTWNFREGVTEPERALRPLVQMSANDLDNGAEKLFSEHQILASLGDYVGNVVAHDVMPFCSFELMGENRRRSKSAREI
ncbi:hypothetical protein JQ621_18070 [Bradyrhizobium manausense]|uniref:hypothetical protein n=1 Tax=Bradyrhizobium manausense TaxID=989370 RepID=UPI001BA4E7E2|nr:hypothetical protein [Bradyrhizobium manausense]MBR1089372.1 hypothetical protein [Bradyrhizobium manausense]